MTRRSSKRIGRLHVLTDTVLQNRYSHADLARLAIAGGADTIQFRQKLGDARDLIEAARSALAVCRAADVPFIVNDRVDVAWLVGADGVHLGQDDFPVREARRLLRDAVTIGVSASTIEEAYRGISDGANYVGFGPIYATRSKADAGAAQGLDRLRKLVAEVDVPVIAIGGIGVDQAADVIATGAHGIAVISAVCCAEDPEAAAKELSERIGKR